MEDPTEQHQQGPEEEGPRQRTGARWEVRRWHHSRLATAAFSLSAFTWLSLALTSCRELAVLQEVGWAEHWEFMDVFCDVGSPEGLALLEAHLQSKSTETGGTEASASRVMRTGDVSGSPLLLSAGMQGSSTKQTLDSGDSVSEECVKQSLNFEEEPSTNGEVEEMKEQLPEDGLVLELGARVEDLKLHECQNVEDSVTGGEYAEKEGRGSSTATLGHMEVTSRVCDDTTGVHETPALTDCVREEMLTACANPAQADVCTPLPTVQGEGLVFLLG